VFDEAMAWWYHAASFLYLTGLTLSIGAAVGTLALPLSRPPLLRGAPLLLVAGALARLFAQARAAFGDAGPVGLESLRVIALETPWGRGWTWQMAAAVVVMVAAAAVRLRPRPVPGRLALLASALGAAVTAALTGHAMAFPETVAVMVPLHALHVAGAGAWMGTLAVLLLSVRHLSDEARDPQARRAALVSAVHRFSAVALTAVAAVGLSGALISIAHLGSWQALTGSAYGQALTAKLTAFAVAGLCGAWNWRRVVPRIARDDRAGADLGRIGGLEAAAGLVILLATSLLAALPMPAEVLIEDE
jgi:putative copper export protein